MKFNDTFCITVLHVSQVNISRTCCNWFPEFTLSPPAAVCEASVAQLQAGTAARTLANMADVLGCLAGPQGGLRSGPAANRDWAQAFQLLEVCSDQIYN